MIRSPFWSLLAMTALAAPLVAENDLTTTKADALFARFNRADAPGASVAVVRGDRILLQRSYGMADVENRIPCATNTNFRLASASKQFTAMAVMILVESKRLSLEETVRDLFPEFPEYGQQITVRQLLNHTSGIIDYEDLIPSGTTLPVLDRDVLRLLMQQRKTYFPPGTKFRYSNSGYALLALIVEVRSGRTFACFLKENIFEPLNMGHTLAYEAGSSVIARRAYGYSMEAAGFQRSDQSLTSSVLGDGGIYSSTADLVHWAWALDHGKLVRASLLQQALTASVETDQAGVGYGFGWYIGSERGLKKQWHTGSTRGFNSLIVRYPEKKFTLMILANRSQAELVETERQLTELYLWEQKE